MMLKEMKNILKVHGKLPPEQNALRKTAPYPNPNHNSSPNPVGDLFGGNLLGVATHFARLVEVIKSK